MELIKERTVQTVQEQIPFFFYHTVVPATERNEIRYVVCVRLRVVRVFVERGYWSDMVDIWFPSNLFDSSTTHLTLVPVADENLLSSPIPASPISTKSANVLGVALTGLPFDSTLRVAEHPLDGFYAVTFES